MRYSKNSTHFFAIATLAPVFLIALSILFGGIWPLAALVYMTGFTYALDMLLKFARDPQNPEAEFPAANLLSVTLAVSHLLLLPMTVYALTHASLGLWDKVFLFWAAALFFGQVSNSNAHELVHRPQRLHRTLGKSVYISLLFGHHASSHTKVHHLHVATPKDPNSAQLGQSVYHFVPRAWWGSFKAGYAAETALQARAHKRSIHPYVHYCFGSILCICLAALIADLLGVIIYVALALYATAQLLLSDYVQHYGLRRKQLDTGKYEPVGEMHSWNSPHWFSAYVMLNAPKHSDHHAHPLTPYIALKTHEDMPMLPRPLPAMATLALFPSLWRRVMDKRVLSIANRTSSI